MCNGRKYGITDANIKHRIADAAVEERETEFGQ